jgi:hypothetical protein
MGLKSVEALETLFKFIARKFINRHKMITKSQAIELYSVIANRVNDRTLDLILMKPTDEGEEERVTCALPESLPAEEGDEVVNIVG